MTTVRSRSRLLFSLLDVSQDWLEQPPQEWEESDDYRHAKQVVQTIKTTNDVAERGVKLISDYATILTKDEGMRQWLLQGVEKNRRRYKNMNKSTLNQD